MKKLVLLTMAMVVWALGRDRWLSQVEKPVGVCPVIQDVPAIGLSDQL